MHWILQTNLFNETEWDTLVSSLERFNVPYSVHKVIPFIGELIPPATPSRDKVICFGSYSMRHTARANKWNPGVYDLFDVNFKVQHEHWGDDMLNADSIVTPFKDAVIDCPTFIRPIDDSKYFAGKVFEADEWNKWRDSICKDHEDYGNCLTPDTLVQLCKPKVIYAEYRYWIVNGEIVTKSRYKLGNRVTYSSDVDKHIDYWVSGRTRGIEAIPRNPLPWLPKAFVIDVCDTPEGIKIVELNTLNSSGLYAGNVADIVVALETMENANEFYKGF